MKIEVMDFPRFWNMVGGSFNESGNDCVKVTKYNSSLWEKPVNGWKDGESLIVYKDMIYNRRTSEVLYI